MAKSSSTVAVVVLTGDVDAATSPTWRERIEEAIATPGLSRLIIDVSDVTFVASAGLALLARAWRRSQELGFVLHVRGARADTTRLLRISGLLDLVMVDPPMPPGCGTRPRG